MTHILDKILQMDEEKLPDADHVERPEPIDEKEFREALDELSNRYAEPLPDAMTDQEAEKRKAEILATLNRTPNPY